MKSIVTFKDLLIDDDDRIYSKKERLTKYFTDKNQEFEIAETYANGLPSLMYIYFELPMLLTDREMVIKPKVRKIDDQKYIQLSQCLNYHPSFPEREDRVRIRGFNCSIFE